VKNFLVSNAQYWLEEYHVDGLRVDAVASMLYRDYSRKAGEWIPNKDGGRENYEAIAMLQEMNTPPTAPSRHHDRGRGKHRLPRRVAAGARSGGLGFGFKWNMGWMNDTLDYIEEGPGAPQAPSSPDDLRPDLRLHGELHAADQPRRGRARQGLDAGQDAGQRLGALRQPARLLRFMWGHPGKKLLFMGRSSPSPANGTTGGELDWAALERPAPRGRAAAGAGPQHAVPRGARAALPPIATRRVPVDRGRRRGHSVYAWLRRAGGATRTWWSSATSRPWSAGTGRWACRGRATGARP
jgi:1,4-alpha-glucan branching enzyme